MISIQLQIARQFSRWILLLIPLLGFSTMCSFAQDIVFPGNKIGVFYQEIQGAEYKLDNQTQKKKDSDTLIGNVAFYERAVTDVFWIEARVGSGFQRKMEFRLGGTDTTVEETASYWILNFKTYSANHWKDGLKAYLAAGMGSLTTNSSITAGSTSDKTAASIPFSTVSVGIDYIWGSFAARIELGRINGERDDLESSSTYYANYYYHASTVGYALYYFF